MSTVRICIIKNSTRIRTLLKDRFVELNKSHSDIVKDARARGVEITNSSLGRFMNHGNVKSTLSQEDIVWLCFRYGIEIQLMVGSPKIEEGKIKLWVPPYNEELCIKYADRFTNTRK